VQKLNYPKPTETAFPNDSKCPICNYFDPTHPDVIRIIKARDPTMRLMIQAQCKCPRREQEVEAANERRRLQANVPHAQRPRTFARWQHAPETTDAFNAAYEFAQGKGPHVLVLSGGFGLGKSHLLEAIVRFNLDQNCSTRYEFTSSFLDRLRHSYDDDSEQDLFALLEWYQRMNLLVLDDLGVEKSTEWGREKLTMVVDERLRDGRRLAIGTNLGKEQLSQNLGPRMASRLFPEHGDEEVAVAYLAGKDRR
jgi:DNA replication protein DnaC